MCSSLLGLGGTYVQQCFVCFFPPNIYVSHFPVYIQKQFNLSSLSYMSDQHHVGLQPANLVTVTTRSCSRRSSDLAFVFFSHFLQFIQYFVFFQPFIPYFVFF